MLIFVVVAWVIGILIGVGLAVLVRLIQCTPYTSPILKTIRYFLRRFLFWEILP